MPSARLKEKLNTQGPVVIKSSVWRLFSPAASLSTADTRWGWPILHYGLSEKESIAASRAAKSVRTPSGFSVRHQSQTDWKRAEQQSLRKRRESRVLIGAMCSRRFFVMTLTKEEFHCKMRLPACEKVTMSALCGRDNIINLYQTS